jgi:ATP-dependent HslUV protease, peptidase subunit HslV
MPNTMPDFHGTTILAVRHEGQTAIGGDGQVTMGNIVIKAGASKLRSFKGGRVKVGFAGSTADAFALLERFERKLEEFGANTLRASVELAKEWRTDRALRRLEALMIVVDFRSTLVLSGTGDVVEPDDGVAAIGTGGPYALAAARALIRHGRMPAKEIVETALGIAAEICIYTNARITVEEVHE